MYHKEHIVRGYDPLTFQDLCKGHRPSILPPIVAPVHPYYCPPGFLPVQKETTMITDLNTGYTDVGLKLNTQGCVQYLYLEPLDVILVVRSSAVLSESDTLQLKIVCLSHFYKGLCVFLQPIDTVAASSDLFLRFLLSPPYILGLFLLSTFCVGLSERTTEQNRLGCISY